MANLSVYTKQALANWLIGAANMPAAPAVYLAAFNGDPTAGGTELTITISTVRVALSTGSMSTSIAGAKSSGNGLALRFSASALAAATWNYVAAYDALTSGNLLWYKPITSVPIGIGNLVQIAAGVLVITSAPDASNYTGDYLVNWCAGLASFPATAARYLSTWNGDPLGAGTENTTSINAAGRVAIAASMSAPSGGSSSNASVISYGNAAAPATVTNLGVSDAVSAGNLICAHALTGGNMGIGAGIPVSVQIGSLTIAAA